jgi:hypothetical protein
MPFFVFTEDSEGRLGYVGSEYFSEVQAEDKASEYPGITHVIHAGNLVQAKRHLRDKLAKKKKDMGQLYKNVRNVSEEA